MSNVLITPQAVAREMAFRLAGALNFGGLVYRDFSNEFQKVGDTIKVRKPATFEAKDFDESVGIQVQAITEGSVDVKLDIIGDISVEVGSKELTLDMKSFSTQFLEGAVLAIRDMIDKRISGLYADVPYYAGTAGDTPSDLKSGFTSPRKVLNINKVPTTGRVVVFDPEAEAELLNVDAIVNADKSGSTAALREGFMGRIMGIDTYMNQNVATHTAGAYAALADVSVSAASKGGGVMTLTSAAGTAVTKLSKGDIFTLDAHQYVVTEETAAAVAGVVTVKVYPAVHAALADIPVKTVAFVDDHVANLMFHKNAFALVSRPLEKPLGGVESYSMTVDGVSVRVTMGYNQDKKKNVISMDCLFGVATLQPELAVRVLG